MKLVSAGSAMPYEEYENDGPVLVLLHGFPNNCHLWEKQLPEFQKGFHILNFNLPGAFDGRMLDKKFYRSHYIQDFILDAMKSRFTPGRKFFLVGHDLGCFFLEEVGRRFSAHVSAQVFISGMGLSQYASRLKSPSQLLKSYYAFLLQIPGMPKIARNFAGPLQHYIYRISNREKDISLKEEAGNGFGAIYLYQELGKRLLHTRKDASGIPTLFIWGNQDRFLNVPEQEEIDEFHQRGQLAVLSGGHWILREKPDEINSLITDFFNRNHSLQKPGPYENQLPGI